MNATQGSISAADRAVVDTSARVPESRVGGSAMTWGRAEIREKLRDIVADDACDLVLDEALATAGITEIRGPDDLFRVAEAIRARGGALDAFGSALKVRALLSGAQPPSESATTRTRRGRPSSSFEAVDPTGRKTGDGER